MAPRTRRAGSLVLLAAGLAGPLALLGCSTAQPPQGPPVSSPTSTSATPTPTPPSEVNATAAALAATAKFLRGNGYTVQGIDGAYVKFSEQGSRFTSKMTCEGGGTHEVGWTGVCAAPSKEAINVVVTVRITAGPRTETLAMEEDTAAYCGDETTPAWAVKALKAAKGQYCYLSNEDG